MLRGTRLESLGLLCFNFQGVLDRELPSLVKNDGFGALRMSAIYVYMRMNSIVKAHCSISGKPRQERPHPGIQVFEKVFEGSSDRRPKVWDHNARNPMSEAMASNCDTTNLRSPWQRDARAFPQSHGVTLQPAT